MEGQGVAFVTSIFLPLIGVSSCPVERGPYEYFATSWPPSYVMNSSHIEKWKQIIQCCDDGQNPDVDSHGLRSLGGRY